MIDAILDLFLNGICFRIGAWTIRALSMGRVNPTFDNAKYPFGVALLGFAVIILAIVMISLSLDRK